MSIEDGRIDARDLSGAVFSSIVSAVPVSLLAALAVQIGDSLHFGAAELGVVVSIYYLSAAVTSIPLSHLAAGIGSIRMMRLGCLAMCLLLVAFAGLVDSLPILVVVIVLSGMASAGIQPATNLFLIRRVPRGHQGLAFGIKQAAVPLAVMFAGLSVPAIALTVGWRWAFVVGAVFALATCVILPRSRTHLAAYRARPRASGLTARQRLNLAVLACGFAAAVASASTLSAFIVSAAVAAGSGKAAAGILAGIGGLVAGVTRVVVGIMADHTARPHLRTVSWMLSIGCVGYFVLAYAGTGELMLLVPGAILAFSTGWGWNGLFNLAISTTYPLHAAEATGITAVGGRIGGVVGPAVFGFIASHWSYSHAWIFTAVMAAIAATTMGINRQRRQPEEA